MLLKMQAKSYQVNCKSGEGALISQIISVQKWEGYTVVVPLNQLVYQSKKIRFIRFHLIRSGDVYTSYINMHDSWAIHDHLD